MVDKKAIKILSDTYWTSAGWRKTPLVSPEALEYAKTAGVMFDAFQATHDQIVARAMAAALEVDQRSVANGFVASLQTRQLDIRSALGSLAFLKNFPDHKYEVQRTYCPICGIYCKESNAEDVNVLNFERHKWGGIRHDQPLYAAIDLELFRCASPLVPTESDIALLKAILAAIEAAPESTTAMELQKLFTSLLKSNKAERDVLIGILGLCGILETSKHVGYLRRFIPWNKRELPIRRFVDLKYPACWWTGRDGINKDAIQSWFGHLL